MVRGVLTPLEDIIEGHRRRCIDVILVSHKIGINDVIKESSDVIVEGVVTSYERRHSKGRSDVIVEDVVTLYEEVATKR